jgi:hypothetical protein
VYSTCLYCTRDLGRNDVLETLPVGRRIAFDADQGRLWVVCRRCEKWNLVPFDTRLETIDACERFFAEAKVRFSTGNIGIARLREGLELVRIGSAQRPEFAAWRYGDQFGRRRIRAATATAAATVGVVAFVHFGHLLGLTVGATPMLFQWSALGYSRHRVAIRHVDERGTSGSLTAFDAQKTAISRVGESGWRIVAQMRAITAGGFVAPWNRPESVELDGPVATQFLGKVLPRLNGWGASRRGVRDAVEILGDDPGIAPIVHRQIHMSHDGIATIKHLNAPVRLALEMSAHEETERTALAGELKLLERQWREADRLAKITDEMVVQGGDGG